MTLSRSAADVLSGHVVFEVDSIDRMYLNVWQPRVGATRLSHLQDALAAEQLSLSEEEMRRLEEPYAPHPVVGHS
jgi:hypothetical protein